jgi:hypothetical protein
MSYNHVTQIVVAQIMLKIDLNHLIYCETIDLQLCNIVMFSQILMNTHVT